MKAALLVGPRELVVKEVPTPTAGPKEVVINVKYMGICGSDIPHYEGKTNIKLPIIPGHEFTGIIHEVGEGITHLHKGQEVSAQAHWGCGVCKSCLENNPGMCSQRRLLGCNVDGALAEYIKVPASAVVPLSDKVNMEEAQSMNSLACSINGIEKLNPAIGSVGVLFGTGHSGLLLLQVLKAMPIARLAVVGGRRQFRMDIARKLGADLVIGQGDEHFDEKMREFCPPEGADFVVESSGTLAGLKRAIQLVKSGGTILTYSEYKEKLDDFDMGILYRKELTIKAVKGPGNCDPKALALLEAGKIDIRPLLTHTLPLEACNEGFRMISEKEDKALRVVFKL